MSVVFYGDPHGEWRPLLRACEDERPDGVVILGDCDLDQPIRRKLERLFDAGIRVRWIPGNHDVDTVEWHDRLWGDFPEGNLHGRWEQVGGLLVAGLGGIFKERVWYPRSDDVEPVVASRRDALRRGLPLSMRDAIFPEDVRALSGLLVDVLVAHEAPSCHRHGFVGIDRAARECRTRLVIHGHHHESYEGVLPTGTRVLSLAKAEVLRLRPEDVR